MDGSLQIITDFVGSPTMTSGAPAFFRATQ